MEEPLGLNARFTAVRPIGRDQGGFEVDIDLDIPAGRTLGLLGPNGAGKSTVVSALSGLLPISTGTIELSGQVLDQPDEAVFLPPEHRRIGVLFQDYLLFPRMSVIENVAFGLRSRGVPNQEALNRAAEWIKKMGLVGKETRRASQLSGGEAQRVALARALVTEPKLLLLDEPLSSLDVTTREDLRRSLRDHLEAFSGPRLVITHDPAEAFLLADQISIIESGRITQSGSADDIRLRPRTRYVADLAGSNFLTGRASAGRVDLGGISLQIADHELEGHVTLAIRPAAVAVFPSEPQGSYRNSWSTKVELVEPLGERTRLLSGAPIPLTIEITSEAASELGLAKGQTIWVAVKATEIEVVGRG